MGFESTIPVFEWAQIFRALDLAATVIGVVCFGSIFVVFVVEQLSGAAAVILGDNEMNH
jgi:hypothetical protein